MRLIEKVKEGIENEEGGKWRKWKKGKRRKKEDKEQINKNKWREEEIQK